MSAPGCSIIVPVHGCAPLTGACVDALLEHRPRDAEIVVVDDASPDATLELLAQYGSQITVVALERQGGYAAACEAGIAAASGHELVLLNNDTLPCPGWLDALREHAARHPQAGIVGAKLLWPDNTVQHAGVVIGSDFGARHVYAGFPAGHPAVSRSRPMQIVTGAAMLIRRELFEQLGGFDPAFLNGWEDVDLCLRAGEAGREVHYCAEAVLYHLESATRGVDLRADRENWQLFRARWEGRAVVDELATYAADGLVRAEHDGEGLTVRVDPLLAVSDPGGSELQAALQQRSSELFELRRENLRLRKTVHERPASWRASIPRRASRSAPSVSVVVPVSDHGHEDAQLTALAAQRLPADRFEVVLASAAGEAGRGPGPDGVGERATGAAGVRVARVEGPAASGRAGALNAGIRQSAGELIVFLADDFVPEPWFLDEHVALHERDVQQEAVGIGPARFPEQQRADPFVAWLEDSGELFGVRFADEQLELPEDYFYVGNASVKRSFLLGDELFDERLPRHAWDDYELGLRLAARGMRSVYVPAALAWHNHPLSIGERRRSMFDAGVGAATFDEIYPPPHAWSTGIDPSLPTSALALRQVMSRLRGSRERAYRAAMERAFVHGYRERAWRGVVT